jgi:hypothetical protein
MKKATMLMARLKKNEARKSRVGLPGSPAFSTTPLVIPPKMLIGEKPPALAPLMISRPIIKGLIL